MKNSGSEVADRVNFLGNTGTSFPSLPINAEVTHSRTINLQMKKHNGYERPLWSFVDDVCVGEPVVVGKKQKQK